VIESESNPLRRELAALPRIGNHPEADVLAAFAEGSLLEWERHAVLGHLAGCAACREVLSLCAVEEHQSAREPELVTAAAPIAVEKRDPRPPVRSWLPWVAAAAGIVIACGVGLLYEESRIPPAQLVAKQVTNPSMAVPAASQPGEPAATFEPLRKKTAPGAVPPSRQVPPEPQGVFEPHAVREENQFAQLQVPASPVAGKTAFDQPSITPSTQTVGLRPAMPLQGAPAFASKVTTNALSAAPDTMLARAHWRINDQGQPERSFGDGAWKPVLPGEKSKMHVLSIANGEVWVGGDDELVYRSRDVGASWQLVMLPPKGSGPQAIIHIRFEAPHAGTIEAADGTAWTTNDGGNTWN
jgi:hypothetical protein